MCVWDSKLLFGKIWKYYYDIILQFPGSQWIFSFLCFLIRLTENLKKLSHNIRFQWDKIRMGRHHLCKNYSLKSLVWPGLEPETSPSRSGCATTEPNIFNSFKLYSLDFVIFQILIERSVLTFYRFGSLNLKVDPYLNDPVVILFPNFDNTSF